MMDARSFGTLSPDVEDRRGEVLSPMEEAQLIMSQLSNPHQTAAALPIAPDSPLSVQAGMLDIVRGHGLYLLRKKMSEQLGSKR